MTVTSPRVCERNASKEGPSQGSRTVRDGETSMWIETDHHGMVNLDYVKRIDLAGEIDKNTFGIYLFDVDGNTYPIVDVSRFRNIGVFQGKETDQDVHTAVTPSIWSRRGSSPTARTGRSSRSRPSTRSLPPSGTRSRKKRWPRQKKRRAGRRDRRPMKARSRRRERPSRNDRTKCTIFRI